MASTETFKRPDVDLMPPELRLGVGEGRPPAASQYQYDPSYYIRHPQQRRTDSARVAQVFDREWQNWHNKSENRDLNYADIPFEQTFHGSRRCLQFLKTPAQIFSYYFTMAQIEQPNTITCILKTSLQLVIPFFSHMKAYLHNHIDELPPIAYCYSELDTIAGYPEQSHRALSDDAREWLEKDVADIHNPQWWANRISYTLVKAIKPHSETLIGFEEFVDRPWLWVTSGASSLSKMILHGKPVRTKFGAAMSLSHQELMACVYHALNPQVVNIDIFIKPDERGFKRRLIANMDLGSYLVAAYVRYLIEWLNGVNPSWMTSTTTPNLDKKVIQLLQNQKRSIPLDESQFDHHLSRCAWLGFLKALDFLFPDNYGVHLFHVLFDNSRFFDRDSRTRGVWRKGMPSGLAITSLGNTLFNYVKQSALYSPIHFALGDDALIFNDEYTLSQLEQYYRTFGAEVNKKKNWTSSHYAEYLHFLYTTHCRVGLPARIYGSLMYGLQFTDVTPLQRLNELTQMFKDFYDRAVLPLDERLIAADLSRAVSKRWAGFSTQVAQTWMHIPKAVNGFGLLPYSWKTFVVKNTKVEKHHYENTLYTLPDQIVVTESKWAIRPLRLSSVSYKVGNTYHLPPIESMSDWLDRMSLSIPGIPKSVQEWGSLPIPLPEIPFVSTSRMSAFASMWKFNAYPNLGGSATSRTSRFILASIGLAQEVMKWLSEYSIFVYI